VERRSGLVSSDGMICTGETYKSVVEGDFRQGASLKSLRDYSTPLEGNTRRAIDFHEGDAID